MEEPDGSGGESILPQDETLLRSYEEYHSNGDTSIIGFAQHPAGQGNRRKR
jgi:hypothetical protein